MSDPCDDWHRVFSYRIGKLMRHAIGIDYNPQFDLCDDCSHWLNLVEREVTAAMRYGNPHNGNTNPAGLNYFGSGANNS